MFRLLLLLFIVVPLVELWLLLAIARRTSVLFTLVSVIAMGALGTWLARQQGLRVWQRLSQQLAAGQMPADPLLDGLLVLVASVLLITPGVLTDVVGFLLLLPPVRRGARAGLHRWLGHRAVVQSTGVWTTGGQARSPAGRGEIIDVEVLDRK